MATETRSEDEENSESDSSEDSDSEDSDSENSDSEDSDTGANADSDTAFYSCPAVRTGASTADCSANCLLHSHCGGPPESKCCYNGCGYSCMRPHPIPYIDLSSARVTACPDASEVPCLDTMGSCRREEFACEDDEDLCCDNGCASAVCISTELDSPCVTAVEMALAANTSELLGSYRPQCNSQGLFRGIQCHAHYCWCVESSSGEPISDIVPFERTNELACAGEQDNAIAAVVVVVVYEIMI